MEDYSSSMFASVLFFKPCLSGSDAEHQSPVTLIIYVLQQHTD